jgi:hypothetical protein
MQGPRSWNHRARNILHHTKLCTQDNISVPGALPTRAEIYIPLCRSEVHTEAFIQHVSFAYVNQLTSTPVRNTRVNLYQCFGSLYGSLMSDSLGTSTRAAKSSRSGLLLATVLTEDAAAFDPSGIIGVDQLILVEAR